MRRQFQKFFPIVVIALVAQIMAPVVTSWRAAVAGTDPVQSGVICHALANASDQTAPDNDQPVRDGACLVCCALQASTALDTPDSAPIPVPYPVVSRVAWDVTPPDLSTIRSRFHAPARAPPTSL